MISGEHYRLRNEIFRATFLVHFSNSLSCSPLMVSLSTGTGEHCSVGSTGASMLPSRMLVGKHSRITAERNDEKLKLTKAMRICT
jgi:hypothetical protein